MACTTRSTMAAVLAIVVAMISTIANGNKGPDISIVRPPKCSGLSKNSGYNKSVEGLLDLLLQETKNAHRIGNGDYRFKCDFPDSEKGSATGAASCDRELGKSECFACLAAARKKFTDGCDDPVKGSVKLRDCSLWFDKIC